MTLFILIAFFLKIYTNKTVAPRGLEKLIQLESASVDVGESDWMENNVGVVCML